MSNKMGAIIGLIIVVMLIGFTIVGYNNMNEDSNETIREQNTTQSIQETLMED